MPRRQKPNPNRKWEEREDPSWLQAVVDEIEPVENPVQVSYTGPCPDCGHEITVDIPKPLDYITPPPEFDGRCRCNCAEGHRGTNAPNEGCGVYAYASFES